jgi:PhnB protein
MEANVSGRPLQSSRKAPIDVRSNGTKLANMSTPTSQAGVQPYLFFGGRCEEAIEFYRKALKAELVMMARFNEAPEPQRGLPECFEDKIMHATLRIGDTLLMASDGQCEGPANFEGFSLSITVPDEAEAERFFTALSDGGLVTMPLEKTFWAPKFGMLQDRYGVGWMVSVTHKPQG